MMVMVMIMMMIARAISWITCRTVTCSSNHNTVTLSPLSAQATQLTTATRVTAEFCTQFEIERGRRRGCLFSGRQKSIKLFVGVQTSPSPPSEKSSMKVKRVNVKTRKLE
jgi:hypothetical protein